MYQEGTDKPVKRDDHLPDSRKSQRRCGIIAFDNHLEGSAIERYSKVVEAMNDLRHTPIEATERPLYGGIALHANHSVVVVLNEQDQGIYQRRLANHLPTLLEP